MSRDVSLADRLPRDLKLRDIRVVVTVAEQGAILKAARVMNVTQPSVTRCLHALEARLGVALFQRLPNGVSITPYGEVFVQRCRQILADIGMLGAEIESMALGVKGQIHVGAMPATIHSFLPDALLEMQQTYPDISVTVIEETEQELTKRLHDRSIDIAVGRLLPEHEVPELQSEVLLSDPMCFVVRPGHPLMQTKVPSVKQALAYSWVYPKRDSLAHRALESAFRTTGHGEPKIALFTSSISFIIRVVSRSDYIGALPVSMFRFNTPVEVKQLKVDLPSTIAPIGTTKLRDRETLPSIRRFEEMLRKVCGRTDMPL